MIIVIKLFWTLFLVWGVAFCLVGYFTDPAKCGLWAKIVMYGFATLLTVVVTTGFIFFVFSSIWG